MRKIALVLAVMLMTNTCVAMDPYPLASPRTAVDHACRLALIDIDWNATRPTADDFTHWLGGDLSEPTQRMIASICPATGEGRGGTCVYSYLLDTDLTPLEKLDRPIMGTADRFLSLRNGYAPTLSE